MKNVKKIICCLLVAVMICVSPLASFVQIEQNLSRAEASEVIGGSMLLELILAGFGVSVASDALTDATNEFDSWINENGSEIGRENWVQALGAKTAILGADLVADVGIWLGETIDNLESGIVSIYDYITVGSAGNGTESLASYFPALKIYNGFSIGVCSNSALISKYNEMCNSGFLDCVFIGDGGANGYSINLIDYDNNASLSYTDWYLVYASGNQYRLVYGSPGGASAFYVKYAGWHDGSSFSSSSRSFISVNRGSASADVLCLPEGSTLSVVNSSGAVVPVTYDAYTSHKDALTSYGGFRTPNLDALDGLQVDSTSIGAIMAGVGTAILAGKLFNDDGTFTWKDNVADSVADAYAQGIADAKAEAGAGSGTATDTSGWLSKILNAILAIPTLIFEAFKMTLTDGFGIVQDIFTSTTVTQELITDIPSTLVGEFTEVFPTADSITQLITGIPTSIVNALTEVFPVADSIQQLITWIPSALAEALGFGADVGTLSDALADIKAAVLAIPLSLADVIADAIAAIFVPDLALVEDEVAVIEDGLAWVPEVNDLVNDFKLRLKASEPPKLYLDFTKAEQSKYHDAGVCLAIDFSWYQRYKSTGDLVFGAFLWVIYIWYLFKRLPDILAGVGIITRQSINSDNRSNRQKGGTSE